MATPSISVTPFDIAQRFIGIKEVPGTGSNPAILAMLRLDNSWPQGDDVAWCSAFVNYVCWLLRLPRSKDLAARSWLTVGTAVAAEEAAPGFDVVVLKRGGANQPGATVVQAPGHVGFFAGFHGFDATLNAGGYIEVLGGNQGDSVCVARFPVDQVLSIRRIQNTVS